MISVDEIRDFANKVWSRGDVLKGILTGMPAFPLCLRFKKTGGRHTIDSFSEIQRWLGELNSQAKEALGYGFTVEYMEVNHRHLGRQNLPADIRFDTPRDLARFIGKTKDLDAFLESHEFTRERYPELAAWAEQNPMKMLPHLGDWEKILAIYGFIKNTPRPGIYLRQLTLPGIDTKFLEGKRTILWEILTNNLPETGCESPIAGPSRNGFERRFGFLYDEALVRFRLLDDLILPESLSRDVSIPVSSFLDRDIRGCHTVFITENKVNGLAFPSFQGGMVVFGRGYGIGDLAEANWLTRKRVVYWGDIDTHGYGILSMLRGKFPHVESILMSSKDLDLYRSVAVSESPDKRRADELPNLTPAEKEAYLRLLPGGDSEGLRIEQELVPYQSFLSAINLL